LDGASNRRISGGTGRPRLDDARKEPSASLRCAGKGHQAVKLDGKVAVVTGGARGIGLAISRALAADGARVCIADIDKVAPVAAREIGRESFAFGLDVTRTESIEAMVAEVKQRAGRIDILVNNAAILDMAPIGEITEASFDKVFAVNVKGLLFTL